MKANDLTAETLRARRRNIEGSQVEEPLEFEFVLLVSFAPPGREDSTNPRPRGSGRRWRPPPAATFHRPVGARLAPEGPRHVATGEAQRNPWKESRPSIPPRRGGGSALSSQSIISSPRVCEKCAHNRAHRHGFLHPAAALLLTTSALLFSCASDPTQGYSTASTFPRGYETISVAIFTNDTFVRNVEFDLADALVKEIEARTPYKVSHHARADTILEGRITRIELEQLSKSRDTGLGEEVVVGVTVEFQWSDARTGRVLTARRDFTNHGLFLPSNPHGEPIELARFAAVEQLAHDIVNQMRSNW